MLVSFKTLIIKFRRNFLAQFNLTRSYTDDILLAFLPTHFFLSIFNDTRDSLFVFKHSHRKKIDSILTEINEKCYLIEIFFT